MSKSQSKDFLNISCIVEDSIKDNEAFRKGEEIGYGYGYADTMRKMNPVVTMSKKATGKRIGLGALISGGIGYYLGKNNEDTHSLRDKIVNMFKHHES
jgi:Ni,Fe-hydrogenase III large subunit